MDEVYLLTRIRRTNGTWDEGVEVKASGSGEENLEAAKQAYHAFLGAYAYKHDEKTDYVFCAITGQDGARLFWEKWEKTVEPETEAANE